MNQQVDVPLGFRFQPTDEQLISSYLLKKTLGLSLPSNHILEKNLYGENANPWDVLSDVDEAYWDLQNVVNHIDQKGKKKVKKSVYVFTKLTRVNGKSRVSRIAGCGTWKGQSAGKIINSEESGEEIGEMKTFTFIANDKGLKIDNWIMHEYSLSSVWLSIDEVKNNEYVVCKISREYDHKKRLSVEIEKDHKKQKMTEDFGPMFTSEEMGITSTPTQDNNDFDVVNDVLTPQQISALEAIDNVLNNTSENDYGQECTQHLHSKSMIRNLDPIADGICGPDGILMTNQTESENLGLDSVSCTWNRFRQ